MKSRNFVLFSALALSLVLGLTLSSVRRTSASGTPRYVSNAGADTGDCSFSAAPCMTITYAVSQSAAGDTINVSAGNYSENVNIPATLTGLTVKGAQAGNPFSGRTFGGAGESTVNGIQTTGNSSVFTIRPSGVTIDGFSVRYIKLAIGANSLVGSVNGIDVKSTVNGSLITNNIFDGISTVDPGGNGTAQAVYLEAGPDNVNIVANKMNNIQSVRSAKGVLIGDSSSSDPSLNILVEGNSITNITSYNRGAYGVQANNGGSTAPAATGYTTVIIRGNTIDTLTGGSWAHAIGLEGDTPSVQVLDNSITNVSDVNCASANPAASCFLATSPDAIAVLFQDNPSFPSGQVHGNNLDVTIVDYGIAVDPSLRDASGNNVIGVLTGGPVDGTCNWWGSADGPGPVASGTGAQVSANVTYSPWLLSPGPFGSCAGGLPPKDCHKAVEENEKNFNDQQKAGKKAFEDQQKLDKQNFDSQPHTKDEKKAFDDKQKDERKAFEDQQQAAKKAFQEQYKADEKACKNQ